MEIFFADDSTQKGAREGMGTLVAFGGALFPEAAVRPFALNVESICSEFGIPSGDEVKWSPKKGTWIYENLKGETRTECYRRIITAASELRVRALVIVWDTGRTTLKGDRAFEKCIDFAFERLSVNLSKRAEQAIIVADRPGGGKKQEEGLLGNFVQRVLDGTEYSVPDWCALNILTTPSKLLRQLQVADLITGVTTAMVAGQYKYAEPLFEEIKPMLLRNYYKTVGGTGLKLFPDDLINLYHWILGEDVFWKVGRNAGFRIPDKNGPYYQDEARS
jgi:hypothetical protein